MIYVSYPFSALTVLDRKGKILLWQPQRFFFEVLWGPGLKWSDLLKYRPVKQKPNVSHDLC